MPHSTDEPGARETGRAEVGQVDQVAEVAEVPEFAEVAVVGAGPAGLAAAVTAADHGLDVVLLDAADAPGGQYYRSPADGLGATRPGRLHHHWHTFTELSARLAAHRDSGAIRHLAGHQVWTVERTGDGDWILHAVTGGDQETRTAVRARRMVLATGAHERQLPFPGWTLPGVVSAAGAQAMLKSGLVLPGRRIVVAGSGPLLQAVAVSLTRAGARVPALVEAAGYGAYARAPRVLAGNPGKAVEGARFGAALARARVRVLTHRAVTEVHGDERVEAVTVSRVDHRWRPVAGTGRRIACDALAVGHGLVPQLELALAAGCVTRPGLDGTHAVVLDARLGTTVPGVWAAGESGGVGGVELALCEGELAALSIIREVRGGVRGQEARRAIALGRSRNRLRAFAALMGTVHRPGAGWSEWLTGDTEVCRCEEVTAGRIRTACEELGAGDTRTVKLLTRAGMGWCQGRTCGFAVRELATAHGTGQEPGGPDRRPLACPVKLSTLADLDGPG
ncbi:MULTISPECIES: FAD/NAD(P)-dependent oxidoreductase [unclassified Streptomyces]|uniref:FAD/NAD(P)-dependent oxidoreductase n=1 Tax=unclassified Streptomyces TaxID=2593676 RepID=UPI00081B60BA|nr:MULTISPECIES: FAD-dependent oxidoreductase [unclassified Streptomyces]MYQ85062.1 FAD-dependent oxidoreductase [Streptomyces sp. SID4936]SCD97613.1 Thioredoxin reductase [Streptomyces sp. DvalAA-43]